LAPGHAGAIEVLEFLGRHLRTDKVVLVAESMGSLTAGSLLKRRPDRWDLGLERKHGLGVQSHLPTLNLDRRLPFPRWRSA
jgi:pimeloyl-ACP methyl ester carboxylesterase